MKMLILCGMILLGLVAAQEGRVNIKLEDADPEQDSWVATLTNAADMKWGFGFLDGKNDYRTSTQPLPYGRYYVYVRGNNESLFEDWVVRLPVVVDKAEQVLAFSMPPVAPALNLRAEELGLTKAPERLECVLYGRDADGGLNFDTCQADMAILKQDGTYRSLSFSAEAGKEYVLCVYKRRVYEFSPEEEDEDDEEDNEEDEFDEITIEDDGDDDFFGGSSKPMTPTEREEATRRLYAWQAAKGSEKYGAGYETPGEEVARVHLRLVPQKGKEPQWEVMAITLPDKGSLD